MRFRSYLRRLGTPLRLRGSITRLRHTHKRPYLALLRLFIPFPSWSFPLPEPVPPHEIAENVQLYYHRHPNVRDLQCIRIWEARDTPTRSLYRMYEIFMTGEYALLGLETEYFWHQSRRKWELGRLPDPHDPDPVRYAILACVAEELVAAFNWRLGLGMRRKGPAVEREREGDPYPPFVPEILPSWAQNVPAIEPESLHNLPTNMVQNGSLVLEGNGSSKVFARRNIITNVGWLYTV
jgi:hypothetical protein